MPTSLPPSPTPIFVQEPDVNRSSSGAVQGETSTPRMLRGLPSGLMPQRSMAIACVTPASRHAPVTRSMPGPSSTPVSSTVTLSPVSWTAARTASAQGESTAIRVGTPHAASAAASKAVPTGPSVSGAATSPRGTKKPVIRPTLAAVASDCAARASSPRLASISACVLRPTSRQTSASMAKSSLFLGDIDSVPIERRIVDQGVDPLAHHVVIALMPAHRLCRSDALGDQLQRLDETTGAIEKKQAGLAVDQGLERRRFPDPFATDQGKDPLRLGLALDHHQVELEHRKGRHLLAGIVADDDADPIGLALSFEPSGEVHLVAETRISQALRGTEITHRSLACIESDPDIHRDVRPAFGLRLGLPFAIEDAQACLHLERGGTGVAGMGLDRQRRVPERHDRVTHVFVDRAPVRLDQLGHGRQEAVHETREALRIELLGNAREAPNVGEHHGDLAQLASELQELRIACYLLDHVRRKVHAEGAADLPPVALRPYETQRRTTDIDRGQGRRRIDRIKQQVHITNVRRKQRRWIRDAREREPRYGDADAYEQSRDYRHPRRRKSRYQQDKEESDRHEIKELRAVGIVGPLEKRLRQDLLDDLDMDLDTRHRILGRRIAQVFQSHRRGADEDDAALELLGRDGALQHVARRDEALGPMATVVERKAALRVGVDIQLADADRADAGAGAE